MSRPRPRWSFSSLTKTTTGRRRRGADDGGADDGAGAVVNSPPLPLRRRRRRRAAPPGQKENVEKDTVAGPAAGPAEPSAMSSAGPLVSWSSACGAMRGHLRTEMRRRQNAIFIDRTSDLYFYFFYYLCNQVLPVPERRGVHLPIKIVWQHDHYLLASHKMLYHSPTSNESVNTLLSRLPGLFSRG